MKRICCEICGSPDILKDQGVFICQACGCKYTLEEVRKMLTEDDSVKQTKDMPSSVDQPDEFENLLTVTRDAMMDSRFENAYYNTVALIAEKPDVPEPMAIQAMAVLGLEAINPDIPTATVKGMERFFEIFDKWQADYTEKIRTIRHVQGYVGTACQAQEKMIREEKTDLESYRYTPSLADNVIELGDTIGMLADDFYSTVHGIGLEQDGRQREADNRILDNQLEKAQEKLRKVEEFRRDQLDKLAKRLLLTQDAIMKAKQEMSAESPSHEDGGDEKNYITINDKEILCNHCGALQPIRRIGGVCLKCGVRFSE